MKLIVHIGTEKTGTTTLQGALFKSKEELKKYGIHFLQCAGKRNNRALASYCLSDNKISDHYFKAKNIKTPNDKKRFELEFQEAFRKEVVGLSQSIDTVIVSSEHFSSRVTEANEIKRLQKLWQPYFEEVIVVCYLREQMSMCSSLYSTSIRSGQSRAADAFFKTCKPSNPYYNYDQMLSIWEQVFGIENIIVKIFDREKLIRGNIVDDFFALFTTIPIGIIKNEKSAENGSISPFGQMFSKAINTAVRGIDDNSRNSVLRLRAIDSVYENFSGRGIMPNNEYAKSVFDSFVDSNTQVSKRYFDLDENLFEFQVFDQHSVQFTPEDEKGISAVLQVLLNESLKIPKEYHQLINEISQSLEDSPEKAALFKQFLNYFSLN